MRQGAEEHWEVSRNVHEGFVQANPGHRNWQLTWTTSWEPLAQTMALDSAIPSPHPPRHHTAAPGVQVGPLLKQVDSPG